MGREPALHRAQVAAPERPDDLRVLVHGPQIAPDAREGEVLVPALVRFQGVVELHDLAAAAGAHEQVVELEPALRRPAMIACRNASKTRCRIKS